MLQIICAISVLSMSLQLANYGQELLNAAHNSQIPVVEAIHEGTIEKIDQRSLTLSINGEKTIFVVSRTTAVYLNNMEATLDQLTPGMHARVFTENVGKIMNAKVIDAHFQY